MYVSENFRKIWVKTDWDKKNEWEKLVFFKQKFITKLTGKFALQEKYFILYFKFIFIF